MTDFVITEHDIELLNDPAMDKQKIWARVRSRPLSEAIAEQRHGCLTCFDPTCPVWQAADQNCWKSQADNDAEVAKAERERVLDNLLKTIKTHGFSTGHIPIPYEYVFNWVESLRSEP